MKWRLRYDNRPDDEKQELISAGRSRFCAGAHFGKLSRAPGPRRRLEYGGAKEFLTAQAWTCLNGCRGEYTTDCIMLKKIYIVAVLVDMIEEMCPWSTESLITSCSSKGTLAVTVTS